LRITEQPAPPSDPIDAGRRRTRGQRYRLPGWTDLSELLYEAKYGPKRKRTAGRPRGPYLIGSGGEIINAYRALWAKGGQRPTWIRVARELNVDERTLRRARRDFGLADRVIEKGE
jgi:hypothetical protein